MTDYEESATEREFIYRLTSYLATFIKVETRLSHLGQPGHVLSRSGGSLVMHRYHFLATDPIPILFK